MMYKNKSSLFSRFKPLLLFPIITVFGLILSCNEKSKTQSLNDNQTLSPIEETNGIRQETYPETGESYDVIEDMPIYNGGESSEVNKEHQDIQKDTMRKEQERFWTVEEMPTFNGGDPRKEFPKFIAQNLQYPESLLMMAFPAV